MDGHYETAHILITKYNADVNKKCVDEDNETPLFNAIYSGNIAFSIFALDPKDELSPERMRF